MFNPFGVMVPLRHVCPDLQKWVIEVHVIRKWSVPPVSGPNDSSSVEMVFIDSERNKIQASLTREVMNILEDDVHEGFTYLMSGLKVVPNDETLKPTRHAYKLVFTSSTSITYCRIPLIRDFGLSPFSAREILQCKNENMAGFLVDMVGVLTSISSVREHKIEGKVQKFILLELTDFNGKVECVLWDDNVETICDFFRHHGKCTLVIGIQFAQVMLFGCVLYGDVVIQDVTNITRIIISPHVPEAYHLIIISPHVPEAYHLIDCLSNLGLDFYGRSCGAYGIQPSLEEEFLILNDRETIGLLHSKEKARLYVLYGKIVAIADDRPWWYIACICRAAVIADTFMYYCAECKRHTLHVTPTYKMIVKLDDGESNDWFSISDLHAEQLLGKSCKNMLDSLQNPFSIEYEIVFQRLFKEDLLFLVGERVIGEGSVSHYYKVKGICNDVTIVKHFLLGDYQLIDDKENFVKFLANYDGGFKSYMQCGSTSVEFLGCQPVDLSDFLGGRRNSSDSISRSLDEEMDFVSSGTSLDDGLGD